MNELWIPKVVYNWSIISVVQQKITKWEKSKTFEYAERAPGVRMIVLNEEERICVTKERRHELNNGQWWYDFRLPWGKVVDTLGEYLVLKAKWQDALLSSAKEAVKIEAGEEVWIIVEECDFMRISPCGATMRWDLYYFFISHFTYKSSGQDLWRWENISVWRYAKEEVKRMCYSWNISEDRSVAVLLQRLQ